MFFFFESCGIVLEYLIISALTPIVSATLPLLKWLMASLSSCTVNGFIVCWCCSYLCSFSRSFVADVESSSYNSANTSTMSCLSFALLPALSCMCVVETFLRLVLMDAVFRSPRQVLRMFAMLCLLSSFLIVRIFFLIILLVSFFACLSLFCVVLRFLNVLWS